MAYLKTGLICIKIVVKKIDIGFTIRIWELLHRIKCNNYIIDFYNRIQNLISKNSDICSFTSNFYTFAIVDLRLLVLIIFVSFCLHLQIILNSLS